MNFFINLGQKLFHSFILCCTQFRYWFHVLLERKILKKYLCGSSNVFQCIWKIQIQFWRTVGKVLSPRKKNTIGETNNIQHCRTRTYELQFNRCLSTIRALGMYRASLLRFSRKLSVCTISSREHSSPPRYYAVVTDKFYRSTITSRTPLLQTGTHSESWYTDIYRTPSTKWINFNILPTVRNNRSVSTIYYWKFIKTMDRYVHTFF